MIDRLFRVYYKKAHVYLTQGRVTKIVFEYYQYNMSNQLKEVKTLTASSPESADLKSLIIEYTTNAGDAEKYTLSELKTKNSQKDIADQYYSYYLALVYRMEMYKDRVIKKESDKIDRTVELGE
jgi:hypothetical protein